MRFGDFELDSGELRQQGRPVRLPPQPLKVLILLAGQAGKIVSREELQQQIWGGHTYVDFERGLNFCITQIRAALGDDADAPRYIETLPKRGYRFIAALEKESTTETQRTQRKQHLVLGFLCVLCVSVVIFSFRTPKERIKIAVLPFENLGVQQYFSDGLTEEMITELGRLNPKRLGVVRHRGPKSDAAKLGVDYILEGSVRQEGDVVRITAQLIRAADRTHLWAESYDRNLQSVLNVESDVAAKIAGALALELLDAHSPSVGPLPPAHDAWLKGRYLTNKGDFRRSIEYFEKAVELDSKYALAYAGLADAYHMLVMRQTLPPREAYPKAKEAALNALAVDNNLPEAHAALGTVMLWFDWDLPAADREFRRALKLNASLPAAHHDYGWCLLAMGHPDEGIAEVRRAQELDPLSSRANIDVGWALIRARRYDEAVAQSRRTLDLEPNYPQALACLRTATRLKERTKVEEREPFGSSYSQAVYYALRGDRDQAFSLLEKAFLERSPMMVVMKLDPDLDAIRSDPRFTRLLQRID